MKTELLIDTGCGQTTAADVQISPLISRVFNIRHIERLERDHTYNAEGKITYVHAMVYFTNKSFRCAESFDEVAAMLMPQPPAPLFACPHCCHIVTIGEPPTTTECPQCSRHVEMWTAS